MNDTDGRLREPKQPNAAIAEGRRKRMTTANETNMLNLLFVWVSSSMLADGLALLLEQAYPEMEIWSTFPGEESADVPLTKSPDMIMICCHNGLTSFYTEAIQTIQKRFKAVPLIIVGAPPALNEALRWFRAGINGYLYFGQRTSDLLHCIDLVREGKYYVSQEILETLISSSLLENKPEIRAPEEVLTANELLVARGLSEGLKIKEISKRTGKKNSTISTFKRKIYQKLNIQNPSQLYELMRQS